MNVFQESNQNSLSNYLVSYYKHNNILLFYEELNSLEPILKDNDWVWISGFNKETSKDIPIFTGNLNPAEIAILSKNALNVIFSLNEFQMNLQ